MEVHPISHAFAKTVYIVPFLRSRMLNSWFYQRVFFGKDFWSFLGISLLISLGLVGHAPVIIKQLSNRGQILGHVLVVDGSECRSLVLSALATTASLTLLSNQALQDSIFSLLFVAAPWTLFSGRLVGSSPASWLLKIIHLEPLSRLIHVIDCRDLTADAYIALQVFIQLLVGSCRVLTFIDAVQFPNQSWALFIVSCSLIIFVIFVNRPLRVLQKLAFGCCDTLALIHRTLLLVCIWWRLNVAMLVILSHPLEHFATAIVYFHSYLLYRARSLHVTSFLNSNF